MYEIPWLALRLGHTLLKWAHIKRGHAIRTVDRDMKEDDDAFIQLHDAEWTDKISSIGLTAPKTFFKVL